MVDMVNVLTVDGSQYQGSSNIRKLRSCYFSVKRNKFIKPFKRIGDSVAGYYEYKILPGTYITFNYYNWSKAEPCIDFEINTIKIEAENKNSYKIVPLKAVKVKCDRKAEILEILKSHGITKFIEIVEDFLNSLPGYHIRPGIQGLSKKIYEEDAVKELIEFLDKYDKQELYEMEVD